MTPFFQRHLQVAKRETFGFIVPPLDASGLPEGHFIFTEWYCEEDGCDCRRVRIHVHPYERIDTVLATISYGWESEEFYQEWGGKEIARESVGANLELMNPQSRYAKLFLDYFRTMVASNPCWRRRFVEHYELFKNSLGDEQLPLPDNIVPMPQPLTRRDRRAAARAIRKQGLNSTQPKTLESGM